GRIAPALAVDASRFWARLLATIEWGVRHVCLCNLRRDIPDVEARSLETIRTLPRAAAANAVRQRHDLQIYLLSRYRINICVLFGVAEILLDGDVVKPWPDVEIEGTTRLRHPDDCAVHQDVWLLLAVIDPGVAIEPDTGLTLRDGWHRDRW